MSLFFNQDTKLWLPCHVLLTQKRKTSTFKRGKHFYILLLETRCIYTLTFFKQNNLHGKPKVNEAKREDRMEKQYLKPHVMNETILRSLLLLRRHVIVRKRFNSSELQLPHLLKEKKEWGEGENNFTCHMILFGEFNIRTNLKGLAWLSVNVIQ